MDFGEDDRGVSNVVGAVFLLGSLVVLLSLHQAVVVPSQNEKVEFRHSQEVRGQMVGVRSSVLTAAGSDATTSQRVTLGTTFPPRVVAVNPPPPSGSLRTADLGGGTALRVANANATDPETDDFWDGSTTRTYATSALVYKPVYSEYQGAPVTVYENSVLYDRFRSGNLTATGQALVSGRDLDLTVLQGEYQASRSGSVSLAFSSPAGDVRTVSVNGSAGDPITVTFPTGLSETTWEDLLSDQLETNGGYVTDVAKSGGLLTVELKATDSGGDPIVYDLRVAAAGLGSGVPNPGPAYLTHVSSGPTDLETGETTTFVVEVRNDFNGPESGVRLSASADSGVATVTGPTGEDGRATVEYTAPDSVPSDNPVTVTISQNLDGTGGVEAEEEVLLDVTVESPPSNTGTGDSTPPVFSTGPSASPSTVSQGDSFDLTATLSDIGNGGTDIVSASWQDGQGNSGTLQAADGQFDQPEEAVDATIDTAGWSEGDHTLTVTGKDANGNTVSETVTVTVDSGPPYLSDLKIRDNSDTGPPNKARFDVEYTVQDPSGGATFDRVEVTFSDKDGGSTTKQSNALSDTIDYIGSGGSANGNEYEITVTVYDTNGNVVEQHTYTEQADGNDDNGDVI